MYVSTIRLDSSPPKKISIADVFAGNELPPCIAALTKTKSIYQKTKRFTLQEDNNQISLVPFLETDQGHIASRDRGIKKETVYSEFFHKYIQLMIRRMQ